MLVFQLVYTKIKRTRIYKFRMKLLILLSIKIKKIVKKIILFLFVATSVQILLAQNLLAQDSLAKSSIELKGSVIDESGAPLGGAGLYLKTARLHYATASNGTFSFAATNTDTLYISYGGYKTLMQPLRSMKNDAVLKMELSGKAAADKLVYTKTVIAVPPAESTRVSRTAPVALSATATHTKTTSVSSPAFGDRSSSALPAPPPPASAAKSDATIDGDAAPAFEVRGSRVEAIKAEESVSSKVTSPEVTTAAKKGVTGKAKSAKPSSPTTYKWSGETKTAKGKKPSPKVAVEKISAKKDAITIRDKAEDDKEIPSKAAAKLLTAMEVNDFTKWDFWKDVATDKLAEHRKIWGVQPLQRYTVLLQNEGGMPVIDAAIALNENGKAVWEARTDNTGTAELWLDAYERDIAERSELSLTATYKGKTYPLSGTVKRFQKGINSYKLPVRCDMPNNVEIAFIVDATGSMGDEINYLKAEMDNIIAESKTKLPKGTTIKVGSVFYKDKNDEYLTRPSALTTDVAAAQKFVNEQFAGGGGDFPEAVDAALETMVNDLKWSEENTTLRVAFLILDAPPHSDPETRARVEAQIRAAARKGIRVVPVTCSGIDKSTEYIMRCMALLTNGTYVALTDDSGIGGGHIAPTTEKSKVEILNDLLVRLILQYSKTPNCNDQTAKNNPKDVTNAEIENNSAKPKGIPTYKVYPNPTNGIVFVEMDGEYTGDLYLCDLNGKILSRVVIDKRNKMQLDIADYPSGTYFIKYEFGENKWLTSKVVVAH